MKSEIEFLEYSSAYLDIPERLKNLKKIWWTVI